MVNPIDLQAANPAKFGGFSACLEIAPGCAINGACPLAGSRVKNRSESQYGGVSEAHTEDFRTTVQDTYFSPEALWKPLAKLGYLEVAGVSGDLARNRPNC